VTPEKHYQISNQTITLCYSAKSKKRLKNKTSINKVRTITVPTLLTAVN